MANDETRTVDTTDRLAGWRFRLVIGVVLILLVALVVALTYPGIWPDRRAVPGQPVLGTAERLKSTLDRKLPAGAIVIYEGTAPRADEWIVQLPERYDFLDLQWGNIDWYQHEYRPGIALFDRYIRADFPKHGGSRFSGSAKTSRGWLNLDVLDTGTQQLMMAQATH